MNLRQINLDMDGTFVNLYGVDGWLNDLKNQNERPYKKAEPLVNLSTLARQLNRLQRLGYEINIISWLAKNSTEEFDERVRLAKIDWLKCHLPSVKFDHINIISYGTPKSTCGIGFLFDDEETNRQEWGNDSYDACYLLNILKEIEC